MLADKDTKINKNKNKEMTKMINNLNTKLKDEDVIAIIGLIESIGKNRSKETESLGGEMQQELEYTLSNGNKIKIKVTPQFKKMYLAQIKKEKQIHRKETRRHVSLEYLAEKNVEFASNIKNPEEAYIEEEESNQIRKALSSLTKEEYKTLEQIAEDEFCYKTYARLNNITIEAAYKRIQRLKERAKGLIAISKIKR
ncbi:MAG: hypothetical protein ACOX24_06260 [Christensenellales bacterium]|jgi:hypothetical protein|nr:hypothetical protein [Clostridiales bacterium]